MEVVTLKNIANDVEAKADVLSRSRASLKVVLQGTEIVINLSNRETGKFKGHAHGIEFVLV